MRYKSRLKRLEQETIPERPIYQIRFVASAEEAERIAEEENYEPWQPGDGIRFIDASSWLPDWRQAYEEKLRDQA